jgi:hypothetical protein
MPRGLFDSYSSSAIAWASIGSSTTYVTTAGGTGGLVKPIRHDFKVGDIVRVIAKQAIHGWGAIKFGDVGVLIQADSALIACFRKYPEWRGEASEFIHHEKKCQDMQEFEMRRLRDILLLIENERGRVTISDYDQEFIYIKTECDGIIKRRGVPRWVSCYPVPNDFVLRYTVEVK